MNLPPPCSTTGCPNVGRFTPTIHVYYSYLSPRPESHDDPLQPKTLVSVLTTTRMSPHPVPVEVYFQYLRLCRACKQQPETLIRSLWPEVQKYLFQNNLAPNNAFKPFVSFEVAKQEPLTS